MNIEQQKEIANEILTKLKSEFGENVVLSGGAPRNWDHGELARDLDFYIEVASTSKSNISCTYGIDKILNEYEVSLLSKSGYEKFGVIDKVFRTFYGGFHVDVILITKDKSNYKNIISIGSNPFYTLVMSKHCVGLSQICYDGQDFIQTYEYRQDKKNSTLTWYQRCLSTLEIGHAAKIFIPKLIKYYPDHKLIIEVE